VISRSPVLGIVKIVPTIRARCCRNLANYIEASPSLGISDAPIYRRGDSCLFLRRKTHYFFNFSIGTIFAYINNKAPHEWGSIRMTNATTYNFLSAGCFLNAILTGQLNSTEEVIADCDFSEETASENTQPEEIVRSS
jgi:hypothetical protein